MSRCLLVLLLSAALAACAAPRRLDRLETDLSREVPAAEVSGVYTDLIRGMLAKQQYYAALAHIQEQRNQTGDTDELRLLEGEALRRLGRNAEAEGRYRSLVNGRYGAEARHGLGLIYAATDLPRAIEFFAGAAQQAPTDPQIRNDYGYALMQAGRYDVALTQIATAVELQPDDVRGRNNLIILLLATGDEARARQVAASGGVDEQAFASLRRQAQTLKLARSARPATSGAGP